MHFYIQYMWIKRYVVHKTWSASTGIYFSAHWKFAAASTYLAKSQKMFKVERGVFYSTKHAKFRVQCIKKRFLTFNPINHVSRFNINAADALSFVFIFSESMQLHSSLRSFRRKYTYFMVVLNIYGLKVFTFKIHIWLKMTHIILLWFISVFYWLW